MNRLGFAIALASISAGCTAGMNGHDTSTKQATLSARTKCDAEVLAADRGVTDPALLESVEPLYSHVHTGPGQFEARLIGAEIRMRPPVGLAPAQVDRVLECHAARRRLGLPVAPIANDPYGAADSFVDIDVQSAHDLYVVTLVALDFDTARRTLAIANAYASRGRDAYANVVH